MAEWLDATDLSPVVQMDVRVGTSLPLLSFGDVLELVDRLVSKTSGEIRMSATLIIVTLFAPFV